MVDAFDGNKAETATLPPMMNAFEDAHHWTDSTLVAAAGMISEANHIAIQRQRCRSPLLADSRYRATVFATLASTHRIEHQTY